MRQRTILTILLCILLACSLSACNNAIAADMSFTDVENGDWFYGAVKYVYTHDLFRGVSADRFGPADPMSRGAFVTVLGRMAAIDTAAYEAPRFGDTPTDGWYTPYASWAADTGIVQGLDESRFGPDENISREQMATIIANFAMNQGLELPDDADAVPSFGDESSVSDWAREGLALMARTGIIRGDDQGNFRPLDSANRAEGATILMRLDAIAHGRELPAAFPEIYPVLRVVDGDTLQIDFDGVTERVRLIGIDTPESVHPDASKNVEYGKIASEFTQNQLEGKKIGLEFDVEQRDKYGRLLAYVYIDGTMFNKTLLDQGHAMVYTYPPNVKYADEFLALQQEAREKGVGIWQYYKTSGSYVGSINSNKYHLPTCRHAKDIKESNQVWFDTPTEAAAQGYQPCNTCLSP